MAHRSRLTLGSLRSPGNATRRTALDIDIGYMRRSETMDDESKKCDRALDKAVEHTFPASDPIAPKHITGTEPPGSDIQRQAPAITKEQVEAAADIKGDPPKPADPRSDSAVSADKTGSSTQRGEGEGI